MKRNINSLKVTLGNYKKFLFFALSIFIGMTVWQTYLSMKSHNEYQHDLMSNVIDRVDREYQFLISQQKSLINEYQLKNEKKLRALYEAGLDAEKDDYMAILKDLREESSEIRLFSVINQNAIGVFKNITGDFLPDCKHEIKSVYKDSNQEKLFLHRSSKSMHYDLLIPFLDYKDTYFFVAFNVNKVQKILNDYSLPHQELFLLRNDKKGSVELSTTNKIEDNVKPAVMNEDKMKKFSYIKPMKNTRWNIAIKLSEKYNQEILKQNIKKSVLLILFFLIVLLVLYKLLSSTSKKLSKANELISKNGKIDPLTGFLNKFSYSSEVFESIKNPKNNNNTIINFKLIGFEEEELNRRNEYSDYYLKYIAIYLDKILERKYTLGRVGNVLSAYAEGITKERVENITRQVEKALSECNHSKHLHIKLQVVGVQLKQKFNSAIEILNTIKELEYKTYKNQITLLDDDSEEIKEIFEDQRMLNLLRDSIINENLLLYKQKIKSVNEDIEHFEVLVRLKDGDNIVPPFKFIPLAEQRGDIVDLDKLIVKLSFNKLKNEKENVRCSINLSGKTLTEENLNNYIEDLLEETGIDPHRITFEVTETYAVQHIEVATNFIEWAREMGFQFALDDFGQGVSSFSYLQRLPINKLKIDGSFIKDIETNNQNKMFVKTMIDLTHQMDMHCVAEFVENDEIIEILKEMNIDYLQGYGIQKPHEWK